MCLSTVSEIRGNEQIVCGKNIASVKTEGDTIILIDLMGVRTELKGRITKIDLMDNFITIEN
jgi:predicted RNA-binding protein